MTQQEWTTWGALTKRPPPWPATCTRCRQAIGTYGDRDVLSDAILSHVAGCTRRRALWRWLRRAVRRG